VRQRFRSDAWLAEALGHSTPECAYGKDRTVSLQNPTWQLVGQLLGNIFR
jgi:hypothetical protein